MSAPAAAIFRAAIGELERQLALTTLVLRWAEAQRQGGTRGEELLPYAATGARTPAQAARLASELARLIDTLETEGIDLARLSALVPEEYSEHWSRTLAFLEIVMQFWPAHLAERNLLSPVARRRRLLRAEVERLEAGAGNPPTIVAGVTEADAAAAESDRGGDRAAQRRPGAAGAGPDPGRPELGRDRRSSGASAVRAEEAARRSGAVAPGHSAARQDQRSRPCAARAGRWRAKPCGRRGPPRSGIASPPPPTRRRWRPR